jgi:hypothetical protein
MNKLKLLFEEYEKSLNEFGVRPAPFPADLGLPEFMEWVEAEFKALPDVISGANDFTAAFSVESILKLLHDFDCADLATFREKLARDFWLASGKEAVKSIARAKLAQVSFQSAPFATANSQIF